MMTTVTINNTPVEIYAGPIPEPGRPYPSFSLTDLTSCSMNLNLPNSIFSCSACGLNSDTYCVTTFTNWLETSNFKQTHPEFFI